VIGRIGGDEFLLVCRGLESTEAAMALAARVHEAVSGPVELSSVTVPLAASIGVACSEPGVPGSTVDSTTLTRRADHAMYRSKQLGGVGPVLHEPAMQTDPV
jgi:diguanylate cyclase (GGDEF)-like protein